MSDKQLSELEWKKFSKGRGYKDAAFLKSLALLDKAKSPEATLDTLADIEKQADALGKAQKADKELAAYLGDLHKALAKQRKLSEAEAKQAARQEEADDEEETPALLTSKLVPLLRQVRKGDDMSVLVASTGKDVAVLLSRRAIAPTRRKLLTEYLGGGTAKFFPGDCVFEDNAYTFVLKTQAAGLAKKVRAALLEQTGLRIKVRVRGEDPNDVDDDGEPVEPEDGEALAAAGTAAPAAATTAPATAPAAAAPAADAPAAASDPLKAEYETRLAAMQPRVLTALSEQVGDASKIRAVMGFVQQKGAAGQYAAALAGLDNLAKLLSIPPAAPPTPGSAAAAPKLAAASPDAATTAFTARLGGLKDAIAAALAAGGARAAEVKLKFSEAGVLARKKDFEAAGGLLDELEKLLAVPAAPAGARTGDAAAAGGEARSQQAEYAALRDRLEADFITATGPGAEAGAAAEIANLRRAWDLAGESADAGKFERALLILKRLADGGALAALVQARRGADAQAPAVKKAGPGLVEQRRFMLERWTRIPAELQVELGTLSQAITVQDADDAPAELVSAIDAYLKDLLADIQDKLDAGINAGDMSVVSGLRSQVEGDEMLSHLLAAPFMDGARFKRSLLEAIDEIEAGLAA